MEHMRFYKLRVHIGDATIRQFEEHWSAATDFNDFLVETDENPEQEYTTVIFDRELQNKLNNIVFCPASWTFTICHKFASFKELKKSVGRLLLTLTPITESIYS